MFAIYTASQSEACSNRDRYRTLIQNAGLRLASIFHKKNSSLLEKLYKLEKRIAKADLNHALGIKLWEQYQVLVKQLDKTELEEAMNSLFSRMKSIDYDHEKDNLRILYATLADSYAEHYIPTYNLEDLIEHGFLKIENGILTTDYNFSGTNLGALNFKNTKIEGHYNIYDNLGTPYFSGGSNTFITAFAHQGKLGIFRNPILDSIFRRGNIGIVIGIPKIHAQIIVGQKAVDFTNEILIEGQRLIEAGPLPIFKVDRKSVSPLELHEYCEKNNCRLTDD